MIHVYELAKQVTDLQKAGDRRHVKFIANDICERNKCPNEIAKRIVDELERQEQGIYPSTPQIPTETEA